MRKCTQSNRPTELWDLWSHQVGWTLWTSHQLNSQRSTPCYPVWCRKWQMPGSAAPSRPTASRGACVRAKCPVWLPGYSELNRSLSHLFPRPPSLSGGSFRRQIRPLFALSSSTGARINLSWIGVLENLIGYQRPSSNRKTEFSYRAWKGPVR